MDDSTRGTADDGDSIYRIFHEEFDIQSSQCNIELTRKLTRWLEVEVLNENRFENCPRFISCLNKYVSRLSEDCMNKKVLIILDLFVSKCSREIYSDNAIKWMQSCLRNCNFESGRNMGLKTLEKLVCRSNDFPDIRKFVATSALPTFIELLRKFDDDIYQCTYFKLKCAYTFMKNYATSCGEYKGKISSFLWTALKQHWNIENIIELTSRCFSLIPQCGNGGQDGSTHKQAWTNQFYNLLSTFKYLSSELFSNIPKYSLADLNDAVPTTNAYPDYISTDDGSLQTDAITRYFSLYSYFSVIGKLASSMLLIQFPVKKTFEVNCVLNAVSGVLNITHNVVRNLSDTADTLALMMILSDVHVTALDLTNALIVSCGRNLIPVGDVLCRICLQALKWTTVDYEKYKCLRSYRLLRSVAYKTLSSWLSVGTTSSSIETYANDMLPLILSDIKYDKPTVVLTASHKKKRAKKYVVSNEDNTPKLSDEEIKDFADVCVRANITLQHFLRSASTFISPEHHEILQTTIVEQFLHVNVCKNGVQYPLPYNNVECRLVLYKTFNTLLMEPHPKSSAPFSYAIPIFHKGSLDKHEKISSFCNNVLSSLRSRIHPIGPTLNIYASEISVPKSTSRTDSFYNSHAINISDDHIECIGTLQPDNTFQTDIPIIDSSPKIPDENTSTENYTKRKSSCELLNSDDFPGFLQKKLKLITKPSNAAIGNEELVEHAELIATADHIEGAKLISETNNIESAITANSVITITEKHHSLLEDELQSMLNDFVTIAYDDL